MGEYQDEFLELVESLDNHQWNLKVNSLWTVKDVVSHLIAWEEESAVCLMDSWQTGKEAWFVNNKDYSEFNEKSVQKYKKFSPNELIQRWKFVIRVLDSEIDDIGVGRIKAKGKSFDWIFDENHYKEHLDEIKKILEKAKISEIH